MQKDYTEKSKKNVTDPIELPKYRRVFNEGFKLSWHVPKKDKCNFYNRYFTAKSDGTLTAY